MLIEDQQCKGKGTLIRGNDCFHLIAQLSIQFIFAKYIPGASKKGVQNSYRILSGLSAEDRHTLHSVRARALHSS